MKTPFYLVGFGLLLGGCNAFSPIDSPSGDEQLLSAARACFDRGDIECAKDHYSKMTVDTDAAASEAAFAILDQEGISMGTFMTALGSGQGGGGLNNLINVMAAGTGDNAPSAAKRVRMFAAYQKVGQIKSRELRGLVRFVSAISLVAEIFAEDAGADGKYTNADLALDVTACKAATGTTTVAGVSVPNCAIESYGCYKSGSKLTFATTADLDGASTTLTGNPTMGMILGAMKGLNYALNSELGADGKFGKGGAGDFASKIDASTKGLDPTWIEACLRKEFAAQGVGGP